MPEAQLLYRKSKYRWLEHHRHFLLSHEQSEGSSFAGQPPSILSLSSQQEGEEARGGRAFFLGGHSPEVAPLVASLASHWPALGHVVTRSRKVHWEMVPLLSGSESQPSFLWALLPKEEGEQRGFQGILAFSSQEQQKHGVSGERNVRPL